MKPIGLQLYSLRTYSQTKEDFTAVVKRVAEEEGALFAVSKHWEKGGEGARELAEAVVAATEKPSEFKFLYSLDEPLESRIEKVAKV